jgi:hypothetical protein
MSTTCVKIASKSASESAFPVRAKKREREPEPLQIRREHDAHGRFTRGATQAAAARSTTMSKQGAAQASRTQGAHAGKSGPAALRAKRPNRKATRASPVEKEAERSAESGASNGY